MTTKRKPISQSEARWLRSRIAEIEAMEDRRRNRWANSYPGGTNIATIETTEPVKAAISTARLLGHACVLTNGSDGRLLVYALPIGSKS